jgi:hypothetical protein
MVVEFGGTVLGKTPYNMEFAAFGLFGGQFAVFELLRLL